MSDRVLYLPARSQEFGPERLKQWLPDEMNRISLAINQAGQAIPVSGVFISSVSDRPENMLGYGTWSLHGTGTILSAAVWLWKRVL